MQILKKNTFEIVQHLTLRLKISAIILCFFLFINATFDTATIPLKVMIIILEPLNSMWSFYNNYTYTDTGPLGGCKRHNCTFKAKKY